MSRDQFLADGFAPLPRLLTSAECDELTRRISPLDAQLGGTRCLLQAPWCQELAARLVRHAGLTPLLPAAAVPVQCTYFEKSARRNWLVAPHQDLSIPVAARVHHSALSGWSEKEGTTYVQPPADVLGELVAVRVHLDACTAEDGPLRVAPGSHRLGRVAAADAGRLIESSVMCIAERGTAWAMRPLLVHASSKASGTSLRRVLHFVFGPQTLPYGLQWPTSVV